MTCHKVLFTVAHTFIQYNVIQVYTTTLIHMVAVYRVTT